MRNLWLRYYNGNGLKVRSGMKILFWEDNWLGFGVLTVLYLDIYNFNNKEVKLQRSGI